MRLEVESVQKRYRGGVQALADFSLDLGPGVLGLLGPNGAGKSTLMRILATVTLPTGGQVRWNGTDIARQPDRLREELGYLPQDFGVYPNLSALEFLEYVAAMKGIERRAARARIERLLELVNLAEQARRPLGGFSGGMRQRVGIAQALLNDPRLLIVDEPTAGLDPEERVRFRNLLAELAGERIVILSTHIVSDVEATATSIALIAGGRLLAHGSPEALLDAVTGRVWEALLPPARFAEVKARALISGTIRRSDGILIRAVGGEPPIEGARSVAPTLEDAYLHQLAAHRVAIAAPAPNVNLIAIARADFLERVRRPGYLVALAFMVYAAHIFLPPNHSSYATFRIADFRGLYNSHWVGVVSAMLASVFVSFAGFYLVKNAVDRDRRTGVGAIVASTRVSTRDYLFGKFLSNLAVLASMLAVMAVAVMIIQWVRGEDRQIDPIAIVLPLLLVSLPMMALTAGIAVVFEATPLLRGGLGNVVFFFLWIVTLAQGFGGDRGLLSDPAGNAAVTESALARCRELGLPFKPGEMSVGFNIKQTGVWDLTTFDYRGIDWTARRLASRLLWLLVACGLPLVASLWFDRFDTAPAPARGSKRRRAREAAAAPPGTAAAPATEVARGFVTPGVSHVADLPPATRGRGFLPLLCAEMAIQLRGRSRWWWLVAFGLAVASALVPAGPGRALVHGLAWIWPLFIWSSMGAREQLHGTGDILFSTPRPLVRPLVGMWLVGVAVAGAAACGVPARAMVEGNAAAAWAWLGGACFVPSLALACGVWSGSGKLFEVLYLLVWYAGPINQAPPLDYGGFTAAGLAGGVPFRFALLGLVLLALAVVGRGRQIRADRRG